MPAVEKNHRYSPLVIHLVSALTDLLEVIAMNRIFAKVLLLSGIISTGLAPIAQATIFQSTGTWNNTSFGTSGGVLLSFDDTAFRYRGRSPGNNGFQFRVSGVKLRL